MKKTRLLTLVALVAPAFGAWGLDFGHALESCDDGKYLVQVGKIDQTATLYGAVYEWTKIQVSDFEEDYPAPVTGLVVVRKDPSSSKYSGIDFKLEIKDPIRPATSKTGTVNFKRDNVAVQKNFSECR